MSIKKFKFEKKDIDRVSYAKGRHCTAKKNALHLMQMGKNRDEIIDCLVNDWGYKESTASTIISEINNDVKAEYDKYIKDVARHNINKLLAISDEQYDAGSLKDLVKTIDVLNKMTGQYSIKIEGGDENKPINITFK